MADNDRTRGHRDKGTYRPMKPAAASGDPLAELARLIGQQNEGAGSYEQPATAARGGEPADHGWAAPEPFAPQDRPHRDAGVPRWRTEAPDASVTYGDSRYDPFRVGAVPRERDHGASSSSSSYGDPHHTEAQYPDGQYADGQYADGQYADGHYPDLHYPEQQDPRYPDQQYAASHFGELRDDPRYQDAGYADPRYAGHRYDETAPGGYSDTHAPEPHFATPHYDGSSYAPARDRYPQFAAGHGHPPYNHPSGGQAHADPYFGAPPPHIAAPHGGRQFPAMRRSNIVTVLAVLALAVVGTAGAFGYRAIFVGSGTTVPPPVIKADTQPTKIVPATDPNSKPIQDRIGIKTEKIVPRQEEPVQQAAPGQPRVIAPFLAGPNPQAFPPASANVAPAASEPKRVRTVPIRPQQGSEMAPAPRSSRSAAPAAQSDDTAAVDRHASLSLAPTGSVPPSQRQNGRQAHAAVTPNDSVPSGSPFPTPLPPNSGASRAVPGPYGVQVTSQRSEADAQASFRSLQQQFPSVLGNRQPVIRRADLGPRGTYYRAQVPFSSQSEANEFCSSLKSAGGQCVVQRN